MPHRLPTHRAQGEPVVRRPCVRPTFYGLILLIIVSLTIGVALADHAQPASASIDPQMRYWLTPAVEHPDTASFPDDAIDAQALPLRDRTLRLFAPGQDVWVQIQLDNPSDTVSQHGFLMLRPGAAFSMEMGPSSPPSGNNLTAGIRGWSLPYYLPAGGTQTWTVRVHDLRFPGYVNLRLDAETPREHQRRQTAMGASLYGLTGAGLLLVLYLVVIQFRQPRTDTQSGYTRIGWPLYLFMLLLFNLAYSQGIPTPELPSIELLHDRWIVGGLMGLVAAALATLWCARWQPRHLAGRMGAGALLSVPLIVGTLSGPVPVVIMLSALSLWRLFSAGSKPDAMEALYAVATPASLLIWLMMALLQHSPLAITHDAYSLVHLLVLAVHVGFVCQEALPVNQTSPANHPQGNPNMHLGDSMVLLRKLNHDLRSPIHGVLGMTSLLSETKLNIDQQEYVTTTHNAGIQMLNLADEMRALTRISNDQIYVRPRTTDLNEFLHDVVSPFARLASQKSVEVVTEIVSTVPTYVRIDPDLVSQVLRIILDNNVKFTNDGVIQVVIRLEGEQRLRIRIDDTGQGIAPDEMGQLFDFQIADTDESGQQGMRLGLPIANELVRAMGGQIGVSRAASQGSSFWVSLPFEKEDSPPPPADPDTLTPLLQRKVMIVDDHLAVRKVLEDQTRAWGMQPELASSGKEALATLQSHMYFHQPFDWVIIDYRMPEMTGLELLKKIRSIEGLKGLRVIVMTGIDLHYVERAAEELGVEAVMAKPINTRDLLSLLSGSPS